MSKAVTAKFSNGTLKTIDVNREMMSIPIMMLKRIFEMLYNFEFMLHLMQSGQIPRYGATAFLISEETLFTPFVASIISQV